MTQKKAKEVGEGEEVGDTSENTVSEASRVEGQSKSRRLKRTGNLDKAGLSQNTNKRGKDAPTEKPVTVEVENPHGAPEQDEVDFEIDDQQHVSDQPPDVAVPETHLGESFFYLPFEPPIDREKVTSSEWTRLFQTYCYLVDVPMDGMCGWFALAAGAGIFHDNPSKRDDSDKGWNQEAWAEIGPFIRDVVSVVSSACNTMNDKSAPADDVLLADHILAGFIPTADDRVKIATNHAVALASNTKYNRPHPPEGWFSNAWGNPAAMILKRMIVVVTFNADDTVVFHLYVPENVDGLSWTEMDGFCVMAGTQHSNLKSLKDTIDKVRLHFQDSLPPVFLHNFNKEGGHFQYYKEISEAAESQLDEAGEGVGKETTETTNSLEKVQDDVVAADEGGNVNDSQEGEKESTNPEQGEEGRDEEEGGQVSEGTSADKNEEQPVKQRTPLKPGMINPPLKIFAIKQVLYLLELYG